MMYNQHIKILENMFEGDLIPSNTEVLDKITNAKHILIYGGGAGGIYTKYLLSLNKLPVYAFLDINAEKIKHIDGIQVYLPNSKFISEKEKKHTFVIIGVGSPIARGEIEQMLTEYGYPQIISYVELFNEVFFMADNGLARMVEPEFYYQNKYDIIQGLSLFEDRESRDVYCGFVKGHATKKNEYFAQPHNYPKYLPKDIIFNKGYDCFIDCGASRGETYDALEKHNISPKTLVMFEPDKVNFSMLVTTMKVKRKKAFLYPCAVYSKTGVIGFSHTATQGSSIVSNNKEVVQCIALDDALPNIEPTFIKMDIEGGEYEALLGAKSIISARKPDLAVCVYHAVNHIWDIPILLKKLEPSYKLYLRSGNIYGMNTVLYATTET